MHKFLKFTAVLFLAFVGYIIYSADKDMHNVFIDFADNTPYGDKFGHFFLFGLMVCFVCSLLDYRRLRIGSTEIQLGAVLVAIAVTIEEFSQIFFPARTLDVMDLLADFAGIVVFSMFVSLFSKQLITNQPSSADGQ